MLLLKFFSCYLIFTLIFLLFSFTSSSKIIFHNLFRRHREWLVSTVASVGTWTSSWLFIGRFLFHLLLVITLVVVVMADVSSSSTSSNCSSRKSTNTSSLSARKQNTSCTSWLRWLWLCWSGSRLCR